MKHQNFSAIILAAGQGTRMKSSLIKVMHTVGGAPLVFHLVDMIKTLGCKHICLVTAPDMDSARQEFKSIDHAVQTKPLGTAHAVLSAESFIEKYDSDILVLYGDTPLIQPSTIQKMLDTSRDVAVVVLGMRPLDPGHYGRIFCDKMGYINRIVEYKEATAEERKETLCNSGIVLIRKEVALSLLKKIDNKNAPQEFYLTDIIALANKEGLKSKVIEGDFSELQGVNTREDLARVEGVFQRRKRKTMMEEGVTLTDPHTVYFSYDTKIKADVILEPNIFFGKNVVIDSEVVIKANSYLEGVHVKRGGVVGPFARLRPGTEVGEGARIGNFVEIKNSVIEEGAKISHLSYVGDSHIGKKANIGAGTITCNYDGFQKHKTKVEEGAFIGSNTALVAPVTIGKNSLVGAGSVITQNVPDEALALARLPQKNILEGAKRFKNKQK